MKSPASLRGRPLRRSCPLTSPTASRGSGTLRFGLASLARCAGCDTTTCFTKHESPVSFLQVDSSAYRRDKNLVRSKERWWQLYALVGSRCIKYYAAKLPIKIGRLPPTIGTPKLLVLDPNRAELIVRDSHSSIILPRSYLCEPFHPLTRGTTTCCFQSTYRFDLIGVCAVLDPPPPYAGKCVTNIKSCWGPITAYVDCANHNFDNPSYRLQLCATRMDCL